MDKQFNWAILGAGRIAGKFAEDLSTIPNANLYAVGSRSLDRAKSFAQAFNFQQAFGSYEELVADPNIDAVYIATRHPQHCENVQLCLEHGLPTLCEKPFAINRKEVERMVGKANEEKVFLMEAMWSRFLPVTLKALEVIENGMIGEVNGLTADFGFKADFNPQSRLFNHQLAGGSILDIGIYPIFLSLITLGMPVEMTAMAKIGNTRIDEQCHMTFKYGNGALANLYSTILSSTPCLASIYGELGTIKLHRRWHEAKSMEIDYYDGRKEYYEFPRSVRGYYYEILEVMECVAAGKLESNTWSHSDSLNLMQLLDNVRNEVGLKYDFED